jgi:hypothetical protein
MFRALLSAALLTYFTDAKNSLKTELEKVEKIKEMNHGFGAGLGHGDQFGKALQ